MQDRARLDEVNEAAAAAQAALDAVAASIEAERDAFKAAGIEVGQHLIWNE